jgi:NTP pyrophosphatase (non-canonical NTP hydrolase)
VNYREEVIRCCPQIGTDSENQKLLLGAMGLAGEVGEVVELIKKKVFHEKSLDRQKLIKELGDVRWYFEYMLITNDLTIEEVEQANVDKLRQRYPNGFNVDDAAKKMDEKEKSQ